MGVSGTRRRSNELPLPPGPGVYILAQVLPDPSANDPLAHGIIDIGQSGKLHSDLTGQRFEEKLKEIGSEKPPYILVYTGEGDDRLRNPDRRDEIVDDLRDAHKDSPC